MCCCFFSRRCSLMFLADVDAVTISSQFSTPITILVCVKNPVPEWSGSSTWVFGFAELASGRFMCSISLVCDYQCIVFFTRNNKTLLFSFFNLSRELAYPETCTLLPY